MTAAQYRPFRQLRPAAMRGRLLPWLAVLVLLFQLLAGAAHHHEASSKTQHCVACALHAQPHAGPPAAVLAPLASGWRLLHALAPALPPSSPVIAADFLRPPPQAPPAFLVR
jgi:hypothetical protein